MHKQVELRNEKAPGINLQGAAYTRTVTTEWGLICITINLHDTNSQVPIT